MTINQYKKLASTIAKRIIALEGNPDRVKYLKCKQSTFEVGARNPKDKSVQLTINSGDENCVITFNSVSNPNNPNYKFRTLKPGSISLYDNETHINVDATEYNFDSAQFSDLIMAIETTGWEIAY
jgi:hypothetical protein